MKKIILAALLSFSLVVPALAWDVSDMNKQIDQTNFLVNDGCSGTLVAPNLILTAQHCVADQYSIIKKEKIAEDGTVKEEKMRVIRPGIVSQIKYKGPNEVSRTNYVFSVKDADPGVDLALLEVRVKLPNTRVSLLSCNDPVRGETAYLVGNPLGVLYSTVTKGIVANTHRDYRVLGLSEVDFSSDQSLGRPDNGLLQISSGIAGGNSGGAAYNDSGELIGVPVRGGLNVIALAVPLSDVRPFLARNGVERKCND